MRGCPACRRSWPDGQLVCPECLAHLVDDLDATVTCGQCGRLCPSRMQTCTGCFALLRADAVDGTRLLTHALASGRPMHRPAGRAPFAAGATITVQRFSAGGSLLLVGADGMVEASVRAEVPGRWLPLACEADDELLFRLVPYRAADEALVAFGADGAAVGTYLREGGPLARRLLVRDETSAPVAVVRRGDDLEHAVFETGGAVVATVLREEVGGEGWADDAWTVHAVAPLPISRLGFVAMAVAVKVLLGRPTPDRRPDLDGLAGLAGVEHVPDRTIALDRRAWDRPG